LTVRPCTACFHQGEAGLAKLPEQVRYERTEEWQGVSQRRAPRKLTTRVG